MSLAEKAEKKILWISFAAGVCFVIVEIFMSIYTRSQSVLMDAVYDGIELLIISLTLFLTPLFHRPVTEKMPFGYAQVESVFVIAKGFMMLSVTLSLSINSIQLALAGGNPVDGREISFSQLLLGLTSLVVLLVMHRMNKSITSPAVEAELYGWRIDVCYSLGLSAAFFLSTLLKGTFFDPILPFFDQIVSVLIVVFMLPKVVQLMVRAFRDLMLIAPNETVRERIREITAPVLAEYQYDITFLDVTHTGRRMWIALYFKPLADEIEVADLQDVDVRVNALLSAEFDNCFAELLVDV
ncbi:MAG: cation transporter [Ruthenibacterium sp.]